MTLEKFEKLNFPETPGVYFFKKGKEVIYVGKATSLYDRVKSYFSSRLMDARGPIIVKMVDEATTVSYQKADSVLEALILEANFIKELSPIYNSREKDNKSFNYVIVTDEKWPRVFTMRGRDLKLGNFPKSKSTKIRSSYGPFPHGLQLREALKIIRKIFPFRDNKCTPYDEAKDKSKARPCFNRQIGMCPGVCTGEISNKEYLRQIRHIELFFQGRKKQIEKDLTREMKSAAKARDFERASEVKGRIFALNHIRDISLLKRDMSVTNDPDDNNIFRIEAYDIAHISGKATVGVMVVMENGELATDEYRKFKIRGSGGNISVDDTGNLAELLTRRLSHSEWRSPDLIVIDGGKAQINAANTIIGKLGLNIEVVSVVKDDRHKPMDLIGSKSSTNRHKDSILRLNSEAHRFAITYHRNLMRRNIR